MLAVLVAACGYQFRGKQNNLPSDVKSIAIPVFKNKTNEIRIEQIFTDAVILQFNRSQMVRVVSEGSADAVLSGTVERVQINDVALTSDDTSRQRRITVWVSAKLTRTRDGKVLWQNKSLWQNQHLQREHGSPTATDSNKRAAYDRPGQGAWPKPCTTAFSRTSSRGGASVASGSRQGIRRPFPGPRWPAGRAGALYGLFSEEDFLLSQGVEQFIASPAFSDNPSLNVERFLAAETKPAQGLGQRPDPALFGQPAPGGGQRGAPVQGRTGGGVSALS